MARRQTNFIKKSLLENNEANFPSLCPPVKTTEKASWPHNNSNRVSDNVRVYPNGDSFDGYYDENGKAIYGKLKFANGDIYEGPIRSTWDKNDEEEIESEDNVCVSDEGEWNDDYASYYEDDCDYYYTNKNYGVLTLANGNKFHGVFCFGEHIKW
jgi:hypothetical protein